MWRNPIRKWSPVEKDYLKKHRNDSINQLTVALDRSRAAINRKLDEFDGKSVTRKASKRSVIGKRSDLGQFFRSTWEADFCRYLNFVGKTWAYEPTVFSFLEHGVKKGTVSYCPDFKVGSLWVEVKGQLTPKGRVAIRRFKKFYPEEFKKLRAVVGRPGTKADQFFKKIGVPVIHYMSDLNKKCKDVIPHWE